ncbi:MAG: YhdP family protein [Steroidobacteraceae bacterium]
MSVPLRKLFKQLAVVVATLVVLCAVLLGAFQFAVTRVPEYRVQLQGWLQERTGLAVEFRELGARLRIYGPVLVFKGLVVQTPDRTRVLATARRGSVGLDVWRSLTLRKLTFGQFTLQSPEIGVIRTREGKFQLVGQSSLPDRNKPFAIEQLPAGSFQVQEAVVSFRDEATGRGPWALSGVSFTLERQATLLNLQGSASLPATLGKSLVFAAMIRGDLARADALSSTFSVKGEQIDLAGWADMLPDGWPAPDSGHGALQVSATFLGPTLSSLTAKVDLKSVTAVAPAWSIPLPGVEPLRIPTTAEELSPKPKRQEKAPVVAAVVPEAPPSPGELISYQRIAFALRARQAAGKAWELALSDVELSRPTVPWQAREIQARWVKGAPGTLDLSGKADRVVLGNLWPLLAYLPESAGIAHLRAMHAEGSINALNFDLERASAEDQLHYNVTGGLQSLAVSPVAKAPGIASITGELRATQDAGTLTLDSHDVVFNMPAMFRQPMILRSAGGQLAWQRQGDGWRLDTDDLKLDSVDGQVDVVMALTLPRSEASPVMDLRAQVRNIDATAASKYLPASRLTAKTLEWLDNAFAAGRVVNGDVVLKGPLRSFPFRRRDGLFLARAQVDGITMNYQAGWAPATQLAAAIEFRNEGMKATGIDARLGELHVRGARGAFPDFRKGEIEIDADARGDFGQALALLRASPVGPALGPLFQRLRGSGPIQSRVSLWIPLQHVADRRVEVVTQFADATAALNDLDAPLTALNGTLTVQQTLISGAALEGRLLGGPVDIDIVRESETSAKLTAHGHALATALTPFIPPVVKIWGATDWQVDTHIRTGAASATQSWQVSAAMNGLGVGMPYPLGKVDQGARPLHADLEFTDGLLARASYGNVRALLKMVRTDAGWTFDRGGVRADGTVAALPAHRGLRIEGDVDRLVLDDWFALKGAPAEPGAVAGKPIEFLQAANVRVGELTLYGYQWTDVRGVLQSTKTGWRVDVAGPDTSGQLQIPASFTGNEPLSATMERLVLQQKPSTAPAVKTERDPRVWPNLRVHVGDLQFDGHGVGDIELKATRVANGLQIDSVRVTQEHAQAEANGAWLLTPDGERSNLSLKIVSSDVGATLRKLNYTPFIEARRGEVRADFTWNGGFDSNILAHASGSLSVEGETGQLSSLQPGAGRVLGLFSVAALPRRLALDFKDLTEKGLSFDTVHGDFDMREGNAYTNNLTLRGPAAEIGIAGRTGLGSHDYDQTAIVTGNLGASLPMAGVLAGGPAIGAAMLLFTQVFKEPLKGITRGYYRITGTWDDPVVERVEAAAIKEAATSKLLVR